MSDKGWIKLNRSIQEHWIWDDSEKLKAWIDLIMLANFEDKKVPYKGSVITCNRGDINLSISYLAKRWGWSRKRVRAFIGTLEGDGMVTTKVSTHRTVLTLENYGKYQDKGTTKVTTKVTTKEQQGYQQRNSKGNTTNNIKNNKERKEEPSANLSDEPDVETWNGKPIEELTDSEWVEYVNSWED